MVWNVYYYNILSGKNKYYAVEIYIHYMTITLYFIGTLQIYYMTITLYFIGTLQIYYMTIALYFIGTLQIYYMTITLYLFKGSNNLVQIYLSFSITGSYGRRSFSKYGFLTTSWCRHSNPQVCHRSYIIAATRTSLKAYLP
jgi:hypothetical protein